MRTPKGDVLVVEYDRFRDRWRVTPGGYEARSLRRALAQATGSPGDSAWIQAVETDVDREM